MTGQNDRQVKRLTGQSLNQTGHCPLTGRYFQPWRDNHCKLVNAMICTAQQSSFPHRNYFYFLTVHITEHSGFKHVEHGMNPEVSDELFNIIVRLSGCG